MQYIDRSITNKHIRERGRGKLQDKHFSPSTREPLSTWTASKQNPLSKNLHRCVSTDAVPPKEHRGRLFTKKKKKNQPYSVVENMSPHTAFSMITPRKPLHSQLIGVSEPTLPATATTKGSALDTTSSNCAEMWKDEKYYLCIIPELVVPRKHKIDSFPQTFQKRRKKKLNLVTYKQMFKQMPL